MSIAALGEDTFYLLDFDRTIANTDAFHILLKDILATHTSITKEEFNHIRAEVERTGNSFSTVKYVRHMLAERKSDKNWYELERLFIDAAHQEDTLQPYATELLTILKGKHIPYGILTYGDEAWQLAKLEAAQLLSVPHLVTRIEQKGKILSGWKHANDRFVIPPALTEDFQPLAVRSIVFLDDKAKSFADLPGGVKGVYVQAVSGKILPSQKGLIPAGVTPVKGLLEAIKLLFYDEYQNIIDKA